MRQLRLLRHFPPNCLNCLNCLKNLMYFLHGDIGEVGDIVNIANFASAFFYPSGANLSNQLPSKR